MLSHSFGPLRNTHIGLALVGLMWVLPFLHYRHAYPLTTFDQEWWSVILGLYGGLALLTTAYWRWAKIPRIVLLPLGLIVIALAQMLLGKLPYPEQGLLYIAYLTFAALLMMLGAWLREDLGMERLGLGLAIALLVGTELSAVIGVIQHFAWHGWWDTMIVRKIAASLYGNVAQPNHYADYIALGLVSLGMLHAQRRLGVAATSGLAVPLLFVLTLSGSRSSWLYLLCAVALAAWAAHRDKKLRNLFYYTAAVLLGFVLMHLVVAYAGAWLAGSGSTDTVQRLVNSDTNGSIRGYLWREAAMIFMQSPLLGVGYGQFALHHFELQPLLRPGFVFGLYNNAHNVVMQLAAETGVAGLLVLSGTVAMFLYGLRRTVWSATRWWAYAVLGVLTIHSLLEYPLWYAYFIAILAVVLGMLDETHYSLRARKGVRGALTLGLAAAVCAMLLLPGAYRNLQANTLAVAAGEQGRTPAQRMLGDLFSAERSVLLMPYTALFASAYITVTPDALAQKLLENGRALAYIPTGDLAYRQALLFALDGQPAAAQTMLEAAMWSYPEQAYARQLLAALAEKDPAHFSALLEFATRKEQEIVRAVRHN